MRNKKTVNITIEIPADEAHYRIDAFMSRTPAQKYEWIVKGFSDHFTIEAIKELIDRHRIVGGRDDNTQ